MSSVSLIDGHIDRAELTIGSEFKGKINGEVFRIVDQFKRDEKMYYKIKHLKSGKIYDLEKQYIEHLLIEKIERMAEVENNT